MNEYIFGQIVETGLLVLLGFCLLVIIGSSFYDMWMTKQRRAIAVQSRRTRRDRPHVSVVVYAHNNAATIAACLTSMLKNRYRHYDIVVVNNKSADTTKQALRQFQQVHTTTRLRMYNKYKHSSKEVALRQGCARSGRGDLVIVLGADIVVSPTFIRDSVDHAAALSGPVIVLHQKYAPPQGVAALMARFWQLSRQLMLKNTSFFRVGRVRSVQVGALYPSDYFARPKQYVRCHYVYDSRLAVTTIDGPKILALRAVQPGNALWAHLFGLVVITGITYSLYMATYALNVDILMIGWLIVAVWVCAAVLSDELISIPEKLRLSFFIPSLYFVLYLMLIAEIFVTFFRSIKRLIETLAHQVSDFYASQPTLR